MELLASPPPPLFPSSPCRRSGKATLQKHVHAGNSCRLGEANRTAICRAAEIHGSEQIKGREQLRRGIVTPRLPVPDHIPRPPYEGTDRLPDVNPDRQMHDNESIVRMRAACQLAARVLQYAGTLVKEGDIINIDVTVYLNGYHGDTSRTYFCGKVDERTKQLVQVTEECMLMGISACKHGASFKTIGERISEHVNKYGYSVDPFVGHGVGTIFHSEPIIWHTYDYEPGFMVAGQTFTIEPTLSMGSTRCEVWDDGWTAITVDGSLNAQFEHTVLVTADSAEILTKC